MCVWLWNIKAGLHRRLSGQNLTSPFVLFFCWFPRVQASSSDSDSSCDEKKKKKKKKKDKKKKKKKEKSKVRGTANGQFQGERAAEWKSRHLYSFFGLQDSDSSSSDDEKKKKKKKKKKNKKKKKKQKKKVIHSNQINASWL